jgi:hypothetical protein
VKLRAEVTEWSDSTKNGVYLTNDSGDKVYGFAKMGTMDIKYFIKPLSIETRGRKFLDLYKWDSEEQGKKIVGSKGDVYYVLDGKCTCPGFKFRGVCKHV